jgi:hypothetical protein
MSTMPNTLQPTPGSGSGSPARFTSLGPAWLYRVVRHHSDALVRFTLSFFAVVLWVTACKRHEDSADDKIRKKLPGIWVFEARFARGGDVVSTTTVAPDGSYVCTIAIPGRTNGPRTISMEGTFRVENGFLIDTITKNSQTNASVPSTNRGRIVRIDDRELVLDDERLPGVVYATNEAVYRKQTK